MVTTQGAFAFRPRSLVLADFDGDKDLDLAVVNNPIAEFSGRLVVFQNDGFGDFQSVYNELVGQRFLDISKGDLDNDGDVDLILSDSSAGDVKIMLNFGISSFPSAGSYSAGPLVGQTTVADLDVDGDLDLISAASGSNLVLVRANFGRGVFAPNPVQLMPGNAPTSVVIADLNKDNLPDIVSANTVSDDLGVFLYNTTFLSGDINLDGTVNLLDIPEFVDLLSSDYQCEGDLNGDGSVNLLDVSPFVTLLSGG